jgi:thiol-disulfide isomerase/thioredoxin
MKFILALLLLMPCLASATVTQLNNPEQVKTEFAKPGAIVLLYFATWCGACEAFEPDYAKLATEVSGARFYKMDCDALRIREHDKLFDSIPTMFVGKSGQDLRDHPCEIGKNGRSIKTLKEEIASCLAK